MGECSNNYESIQVVAAKFNSPTECRFLLEYVLEVSRSSYSTKQIKKPQNTKKSPL